VVESTGFFRKRADAAKHLEAGAKKVIISAPSPDADNTICVGINDDTYDGDKHHIISNASCTTNCLAQMVKPLHDALKIKRGMITTIHAYTNDQKILDLPHKDLRRARAAGLSMIPTSTGAAKAIGLVMPELAGKLNGGAVRVPTKDVSLTDLVCEVEKDTTVEEVNALLKKAATEGPQAKVFDFCEEPLVSVDFTTTSVSCTLDSLSTQVMQGNMIKILGWYDNEYGYASRVIDLMDLMNG
jgi:glyceraldehyde 3-phosphate dehydrogenase